MDIEEPVKNPNDVRILVKSSPNPIVIIIDEFDRVPATNNARRLMADTIKLFSDTNVNATIIIVGVAESINELFVEHQSIARNIAQVIVEPMDNAELAEIIQAFLMSFLEQTITRHSTAITVLRIHRP